MTQLYQRNILVSFESNGFIFELNPELEIAFSCDKTRSRQPNEHQVTITNLSAETRKALKEAGATLRLYAGYDGEAVLLAQGNIVKALTTWEGADCQTTIDFMDGIKLLKEGNLTLSFKPGSTVGQVLGEIRRVLKVPIKQVGFQGKESFRSGYSYVGKPARALDEVLRRAEARWSVQNGVLVVTGSQPQNSKALFVISEDTGLVGRVAEVETTVDTEKVASKGLAKRAKSLKGGGSSGAGEEPTLSRSGYEVTTLLYPQINPGDLIELDCKDAKGVFAVDEISHSGGNRTATMQSRMVVYAS